MKSSVALERDLALHFTRQPGIGDQTEGNAVPRICQLAWSSGRDVYSLPRSETGGKRFCRHAEGCESFATPVLEKRRLKFGSFA